MTLTPDRDPNLGFKTPHAGGDHVPPEVQERPTQEFDNTPLREAVNMGLTKDTYTHEEMDEATRQIVDEHRGSDTYQIPAPSQEKGKKKRNLIIGGIAAGLTATVAAGAVMLGGGGSKGNENEGPALDQRPGVGAPADPNFQPFDPNQLTGSGATPGEVNNIPRLAYPYLLDKDTTIETQDQLEREYSIWVDETPRDQVPQEFVNRLNIWINSAKMPETRTYYENAVSSDGQYRGRGAVAQDVIAPAWGGVLTAATENSSQDPASWVQVQKEVHQDTLGHAFNTEGDPVPYEIRYTIEREGGTTAENSDAIDLMAYDDEKNLYSWAIYATLEDNGDQNSLAQKRTEDTDGFRGINTPVYKVPVLITATFSKLPGPDGRERWQAVSITQDIVQ